MPHFDELNQTLT